MTSTIETILLYTIGAGLLSIVYGYLTGKNILNSSAGNSKMQDIASAIQIGAKAYLARQYKTIAIVGVVVLVIVSFAFSMLVGLGYLIGATLSGIAGYVGMLVSVQANVRTAEASKKGLASGLSVAFKSGAVTGMLVAGLALLSIAVYYYLLLKFQKLEIFLRVLKKVKLLMKKGIKLPLKIKVIFIIFKSYLLPFIAFFVLSAFYN